MSRSMRAALVTRRSISCYRADARSDAVPSQRTVGVRETVLALTGFVALGAAVFGRHVAHGGFYADDWSNAALATQGFFPAVRRAADILGSKPLLAPVLMLPHVIFGTSVWAHLALAVVLASLTSACLYVLLRTLGLGAAPSWTMGGLALLFPWSDSARLWATGSVNNVAVCAYLVGVTVALRGFDARGRKGIALHAAAVTLYAASVLTYEITGAPAVLSVFFYAYYAGWRRALRRWPADLAAVGAALVYSALTTVKFVAPPGAELRQVLALGNGARKLLLEAALPVGAPRGVAAALLVAVASAAALALVGVVRSDGATRRRLRRWLSVLGAGVLAVGAGYAMFIPDTYWVPQRVGLENRVNLLAAIGYAVVLYSAAMIVGLLAAAAGGRRGIPPVAVASALSALLAVGYAVKVERDVGRYDRAAALQERLLAVVARAPRLAAGSAVFAFGSPAEVAPWVPVFSESFDFDGAVKVVRRDDSLVGYPVFAGAVLACGPGRSESCACLHPTPTSPSASPAGVFWYGRAVLVDARTGDSLVVLDRMSCRAAVARLSPGPYRG